MSRPKIVGILRPDYVALIQLFDEWERLVPEDAKWAQRMKAQSIDALRSEGELAIFLCRIYEHRFRSETLCHKQT